MSREQVAQYLRTVGEGADLDALHDLLIAQGAPILDQAVPYLIVATRNRLRSTIRRDQRRKELETRAAQEPGPSVLEPPALFESSSMLSRVVEALAELDPTLAFPVWWYAAGYSDREIVGLWNDAGLEPPDPSLAVVRKRRERGRRLLREAIGESTDEV